MLLLLLLMLLTTLVLRLVGESPATLSLDEDSVDAAEDHDDEEGHSAASRLQTNLSVSISASCRFSALSRRMIRWYRLRHSAFVNIGNRSRRTSAHRFPYLRSRVCQRLGGSACTAPLAGKK